MNGKLLKIFIIFIVLFVLLSGILILFSQTALFRSLLVNLINNFANRFFAVDFVIERMEGNLYNKLEFYNILISDDLDEIINIPKISFNYNLKRIFNKRIEIIDIKIDTPVINLHKTNDEWNISTLLDLPEKADETKISSPDSVGFDWIIELHNFFINNAQIKILTDTENEMLPYNIKDFNLRLSSLLNTNRIEVELHNLTSEIIWYCGHKIKLDRFEIKAEMIDDFIDIENIFIKTKDTIISSKANIALENLFVNSNTDIKFNNMQEWIIFIPDINPDISFGVKSIVKTVDNTIEGKIDIIDDTGTVNLKMFIKNPSFYQKNGDFAYASEIIFNNFKPVSYLAISDSIPDFPLNGILKLSGNTNDYKNGLIEFYMGLNDIILDTSPFFNNKIEIKSFNWNGITEDNSLNSSLSVVTDNIGEISAKVSILDISNLFGLDFQGNISHLNLEPIMSDSRLQSNLNFEINASSIDFHKNPIELELNFVSSYIFDIDIDELFLLGKIDKNNNIELESLKFSALDNVLELKGNYFEDESFDLLFSLEFQNISSLLSPWIQELEGLTTYGKMDGQLSGRIDDIYVNSELEILKTLYNDISIEKITGNIELNVTDKDIFASNKLKAEKLIISEINIDKIFLKSDFKENYLNLFAVINQTEDLSLETDLGILIEEEIISANINKFNITAYNDIWKLSKEKSYIEYKDDSVLIKDFNFVSDTQFIKLEGLLSLKEQSDFFLEISNFDILPFIQFLDTAPLKSGILDIFIKISGYSDNPAINSSIKLSNAEVYELNEITVISELNYNSEKETSTGQINIIKKGVPIINIFAKQPMKISLDEGYIIHQDNEGIITLKTADIDMEILKDFTESVKNITGILKADLKIYNPFNNLLIKGNANISDGGFYLPELGTRYRNLNLDLDFNDNTFELKKLNLKSVNNGVLNGSGMLMLGKNSEEDLSKIDLNIDLNDFPLISTSGINLIANSNLKLFGSLSVPVYDGFVDITRGRVNLDYLMGGEFADNSEPPLLLEAKRIDGNDDTSIEEDETQETSHKFFDLTNLRGKLVLKFNKNFWIRSSDMNIELKADINIVKNDIDFELFGAVSAIRGFYVFFGKRFQIEKGEIIFSGGNRINPDFLISTIYSFRGADMSRKDLKLLVSGNLDDLDISFELNNQSIDKTDAISYILFGRTFDELSQGEKTEATNHAVVLGGFFASKLTEQLTAVVGDRFSFDHLEFSSDAATALIGVEVGKYITDELFVSIKKDFNLGETNEHVYEEIMVEYEISRFLYLKAIKSNSRTTGMDLIWRFQWK